MPDDNPVHFSINSAVDDRWQNLVLGDLDGTVYIAPAGTTVDQAAGYNLAGWTSSRGLTYRVREDPLEYEYELAVLERRAAELHQHDREQRRTERRRRRAPVTPPPVGDTLGSIDDALEQRCACGCRKVLTDDSPSAYYATQSCQEKWMSRQATNPQEVQLREDAAPYVGVDSAAWPLSTPEATAEVDEIGFRVVSAPAEDPLGLAYTRDCGSCGGRYQPYVEEDVTTLRALGSADAVRSFGQLASECGNCEEPLPGPSFVGTVVEIRGSVAAVHVAGRGEQVIGYDLELRDQIGRAKANISRAVLDRAVDRAGLIARTWQGLEEELNQFARQWQGRAGLDADRRLTLHTQIAAACMDPQIALQIRSGS